MSITEQTLNLHNRRRAQLRTITDGPERVLTRGFAQAWNAVQADLDAAILEAVARVQAGETLTFRQLNRVDRFRGALARLAGQLDDLAATGRVEIVGAAEDAISLVRDTDARVLASQFPASVQSEALASFTDRTAGLSFDRIVDRSRDRIVSRLQPLSSEAQASMRRQLIRGITVGDNPRVTASRMLSRIEGEFAGGLVRALRVARTETLDAYRGADQLWSEANEDVIRHRQWLSARDERVCGSCIAMDGTEWPVGTFGPEEHVNGRCVFIDVVRPWSQLGFATPEPPSVIPDAKSWFDSQPFDVRRQIMGPGRLAALDDGRIGWDDLSRRVENPDWRPSFQLRPLKDLGIETAAA